MYTFVRLIFKNVVENPPCRWPVNGRHQCEHTSCTSFFYLFFSRDSPKRLSWNLNGGCGASSDGCHAPVYSSDGCHAPVNSSDGWQASVNSSDGCHAPVYSSDGCHAP
eukprot:297180-Prorocentrum_minimum.AAC.1